MSRLMVNPGSILTGAEKAKRYKQSHPDRVKASKKSYVESHQGHIKAYQEKYYALHKEERIQKDRQRNQKLRDLFLEMYGGQCECCGESEPKFLSIDHIKGQKGQLKKETGSKAYKKATEKLDKSHYRILCHNCNFATRFEGDICPHKLR